MKQPMNVPLCVFFSLVFMIFGTPFTTIGAQTAVELTANASAEVVTALQHYRAGRDLEAQNRLNDATQRYDDAVRLCRAEIDGGKASSDTYAVLTWAMRRQNKHDDVLTWGERALALFPNDIRIIETMGQSLFYLGDYARSLSHMQRYTNSIPQGGRASVAYFFIGEIYRLRRQFQHADIAYTMAVRQEPGLPLWWYRLGSVREAAGDFPQALEAYERAVALNPNYQEASSGLARSRSQTQAN